MLALLAVPLNGMAASRTSSLTPLRTTFVPFDSSLQASNPAAVQFSVAASSAKRIVLAANVSAFSMQPNLDLVSCCWTLDGHAQTGADAIASGRSPPSA